MRLRQTHGVHGLSRRHDLELTNRELEAAVRSGALTRVTRGWYAAPDADPEVMRAVRLNARLTCLSACASHGLWVPLGSDRELHVAVRQGTPPITSPGVVGHRLPYPHWGTDEPIMPLEVCLDHVLRHHSVETALMVLESAVDRGHISEVETRRLIERQSVAKRSRGLQFFDPRSGSGTETRVRLWFQRRGWTVVSQPTIGGVGRVDLLVGRSLIVELDSREWHWAEKSYEDDHRRDVVAFSLGFSRVRLTWKQVFLTWDETCRYLRAGMAIGRHRLQPAESARIARPFAA